MLNMLCLSLVKTSTQGVVYMNYRPLGTTGLNVSALSYGASALGSMYRNIDESQGIRTVHEALDLGINLIDVSPYYGLTKAETVLGKAIKQTDRSKFILSTKAGRYGENEFDFSPNRIITSVEESMRRLNTDYIDILFLHDIEFADDLDRVIEESIPTLEQLKQDGKIRFGGVSGYPLPLFERVLAQTDVDAILSYCHYSLNDDSLTSLLPLVEEKNVALVNASPLSMGLLTQREAPPWHPADKQIIELCKQAAEHCASKGEDISKLAVQFSVSNPKIPTTLVSTASPENIHKNVSWANEPINQELLSEVQDIIAPIQNKTWSSGQF